MKTQLDELKMTIEKLETGVQMAVSTEPGRPNPLTDLTRRAKTLLKEIGGQPGPSTSALAGEAMTNPTAEMPKLVLHDLDFWEISRQEQTKPKLIHGMTMVENFLMGEDTFELNWHRINTTLGVRRELEGILALDGYRLNKAGIKDHLIKLWKEMMKSDHSLQQGFQSSSEQYYSFIKKLHLAIDRVKDAEVDGVDIFGNHTVLTMA